MKKMLLIALLGAMTAPAWAWGKMGHRIICSLAYIYLTDSAQAHVDAVLGKRGMIYYASWADDIKCDTIYPNSFDWHFQDLDTGFTDLQLVRLRRKYPEEGGNLFRATDSLYESLQHNRNQADALKFYIHLSGDRFCPMHMGHPKDQGGNKVSFKWFDVPSNLHKVWDEALIEYQQFSVSEYATCLHDTYKDRKVEIEKRTTREELSDIYSVTQSIYRYQTTYDGNCKRYAYVWTPIMDFQLYCSAVELAKSLNQLYK